MANREHAKGAREWPTGGAGLPSNFPQKVERNLKKKKEAKEGEKAQG